MKRMMKAVTCDSDIMSVQAFGVDAALRADAFGVVPCFRVGVLAGSLICTVPSSVSFFIVCGVLDHLLHGGYGIIFLSLLAVDRCFPDVLGFGSAVSAVPDELGSGHHPFDHLLSAEPHLCHDWPCVPLLQLVCRLPFRTTHLDHRALPKYVVPVAWYSTPRTCGGKCLGVQQLAVSFCCGHGQPGWRTDSTCHDRQVCATSRCCRTDEQNPPMSLGSAEEEVPRFSSETFSDLVSRLCLQRLLFNQSSNVDLSRRVVRLTER